MIKAEVKEQVIQLEAAPEPGTSWCDTSRHENVAGPADILNLHNDNDSTSSASCLTFHPKSHASHKTGGAHGSFNPSEASLGIALNEINYWEQLTTWLKTSCLLWQHSPPHSFAKDAPVQDKLANTC